MNNVIIINTDLLTEPKIKEVLSKLFPNFTKPKEQSREDVLRQLFGEGYLKRNNLK